MILGNVSFKIQFVRQIWVKQNILAKFKFQAPQRSYTTKVHNLSNIIQSLPKLRVGLECDLNIFAYLYRQKKKVENILNLFRFNIKKGNL